MPWPQPSPPHPLIRYFIPCSNSQNWSPGEHRNSPSLYLALAPSTEPSQPVMSTLSPIIPQHLPTPTPPHPQTCQLALLSPLMTLQLLSDLPTCLQQTGGRDEHLWYASLWPSLLALSHSLFYTMAIFSLLQLSLFTHRLVVGLGRMSISRMYNPSFSWNHSLFPSSCSLISFPVSLLPLLHLSCLDDHRHVGLETILDVVSMYSHHSESFPTLSQGHL